MMQSEEFNSSSKLITDVCSHFSLWGAIGLQIFGIKLYEKMYSMHKTDRILFLIPFICILFFLVQFILNIDKIDN